MTPRNNRYRIVMVTCLFDGYRTVKIEDRGGEPTLAQTIPRWGVTTYIYPTEVRLVTESEYQELWEKYGYDTP